MNSSYLRHPALWLLGGLVVGALLVGKVMSPAPLQATATHGQDNFSVCTVPVNGDSEAVVFLDSLTGDLTGGVLSPNGKFAYKFDTNVVKDLGADAPKAPKFLMVSGAAKLATTTAAAKMAPSVIYIVEVGSGTCLVYGIPAIPKAQQSAFVPIASVKMRTVAVRPGG